MVLYKGNVCDWEMVGGLEIHAQISSSAKLFSGASAFFGAEPNDHVSFVDAAFPGMLPVVNEECIRQAVRVGLALGAEVNLESEFARKNYFYPDLPQGYQISQFDKPIIGAGSLSIEVDGEVIVIGIERLHLEQDAGKSIHDKNFSHSYIDLNRCGVALMEIVTRPDLRCPAAAVACVEKVRSILRYLGACDGDMSQGSMRADMNVSMRRVGADLGVRAEIKNINSLRFLRQAIEFEISRQIGILESGGSVVQETRLFDSDRGETRSMRSKEDAHDYRYFPDPDLLPLRLSSVYVEELRGTLPELPDVKSERFICDYGLSFSSISVLVSDRVVADYFEVAVAEASGGLVIDKDIALVVCNWILSELFGLLNKFDILFTDCPISGVALGELVRLIYSGDISGKMGKDIFVEMFSSSRSASDIISERGIRQVSNEDELSVIIDGLISDNGKQVLEYRNGRDNVLGWFVGQVMKATGGNANPQVVNRLLRERLDK